MMDRPASISEKINLLEVVAMGIEELSRITEDDQKE
jgi:hypothetical protein